MGTSSWGWTPSVVEPSAGIISTVTVSSVIKVGSSSWLKLTTALRVLIELSVDKSVGTVELTAKVTGAAGVPMSPIIEVEVDGKYYLQTLKDIKKGEELTLKYTLYKVWRLLKH